MGYRTEAIGTFATLMPPKKDAGQKTKAKWLEFITEMKQSSQGFVTAARTGSPAEVKTAADKLNNSCNACHSIFR
jgi:cytochrome c556